MHDLIVQKLSGPNLDGRDIARHLCTRMNSGKAVIIADNPRVLISLLRKQWLRLARKMQVERASTLDQARIRNLRAIVDQMYDLKFTLRYPPGDYPGDVFIASIEQVMSWAPECSTLYVTCPMSKEQLYLVTAWMPKGGMVVLYG